MIIFAPCHFDRALRCHLTESYIVDYDRSSHRFSTDRPFVIDGVLPGLLTERFIVISTERLFVISTERPFVISTERSEWRNLKNRVEKSKID